MQRIAGVKVVCGLGHAVRNLRATFPPAPSTATHAGLYVKRPSAMIEYYRQASLEEKLNTTDLTLTKKPTKPKQP